MGLFFFNARIFRRFEFTLLAAIFILSGVVYGQSLFNDFVRLDDGMLITENPAIREISPASIAWIFTHYDPELYIPLTFFSYQLDYLMGGNHPFIYHFTSLIFHALNAFLVFLITFRLSGRQWVGIFCALLFAVHPLHTEAVAWASGRKDVLSGFFFLTSIAFYLQWLHTKDETGGRQSSTEWRMYWLSVVAFFLGLLSKVSIVQLPFILILLDGYRGRRITKESVREKLPFILLSLIFGIIALYGKRSAIVGVTALQTILMAARSTVFYIQKIFVPTDLSVLYPTERGISVLYPEYFVPAIIAVLLFVLLSFFRNNRTILFSGMFFMLMIAPSFQNFAKDGDYFFASDRYAYLASIGVIFLVTSFWFSNRITRMSEFMRRFIAGAVVVLFAVLSHAQSNVWSNTETLFDHAVLLHPNDNDRAYNNLGNVYRRQDRSHDAIAMFQKALEISPKPKTLGNLGAVYRKEGMIMEALNSYRKAIEINPDDAEPYFGLGLVYAQTQDWDNAVQQYQKAIDRDPQFAEAYNNMGSIYLAAGKILQAIDLFRQAIKVHSLFVQAYYNLGVALTKVDLRSDAIRAYQTATTLLPDAIPVRINLGILLYEEGRSEEARMQFREILKYDSDNETAHSALRQMGER